MVYLIIGLVILSLFLIACKTTKTVRYDLVTLALMEIKAMQKCCDYDIFCSHLSKLKEISVQIKNSSEDAKQTFNAEEYKKTFGTLTRRQRDYIDNPDLETNHRLIALLKARFFCDFCENMIVVIDKTKSQEEKRKKEEFIKRVAIEITTYLECHNHIGLVTGVIQDAKAAGVDISTTRNISRTP